MTQIGSMIRRWTSRLEYASVANEEGQITIAAVALLTVAGFGALGFISARAPEAPRERNFAIVASRYAYEPEVIRVNRGDTVRLTFAALDSVHGFYLEGYDLDVTILPMRTEVEVHRPSRPDEVELAEEITFVADRSGKFRYRCSKTCGFLHPFMLGELIVEPNRLLPTSIGLSVGVLVAGLLLAWTTGRK